MLLISLKSFPESVLGPRLEILSLHFCLLNFLMVSEISLVRALIWGEVGSEARRSSRTFILSLASAGISGRIFFILP